MDMAMAMDITTQAANKRRLHNKLAWHVALVMAVSVNADAATSEIKVSAGADITFTERKYDDGTTLEALTYELSPTLAYTVDGNKLDLAFVVSHTQLGSDDQSVIDNQHYTDFSASLIAEPLHWWKVTLSANRNYRTTNPFDNALGGRYFNTDSLSEITTYQAGTEFILNNRSVVGTLGARYGETNSDLIKGTQSFFTNFDNKSVTAYLQLAAPGAQGVFWAVSANQAYIQREAYSDYESVSAAAQFSAPLYQQLFMRVQGSHEKYDVDGINANFGGLQYRDQTSYGAGLEWRRSAKKFIAVTYNSADRAGLEDRESYVGVDLAWAFSERTSVAADYGKRFYGTAKSLTIRHENRSLTSSIGHKEDISTFSRLGVEQDIAVYVCPIDAAGVFDCNRAEGDYVPLPGEFLINTIDNIAEVNEEVRFNKRTFANFAWDVTAKSNLGLGLNHSETLYLETNRLRETDSANLFWRYRLNKSSNINASLTWRDDQGEGGILEGESISLAVGHTRQLGRHLDFAVNYRFLDRTADNAFYSLRENKLSVAITYQF